jgi:hypothetical protein
MSEFDVLDHRYPITFVSNDNKIPMWWLQVLSNDALLGSVQRFRAGVPSGQRTKAGLTKLLTTYK